MTEVGPVSYQCPANSGTLHIIESAYLAEIVDPKTAAPVPNGDAGELVLTTLDRIGSPLLRYRTGDLVRSRAQAGCSCGRNELVLDGGILGRADDMAVVRGVNIYPSLIEEIVRGFPEVAEYRVQLDCRQAMTEMLLEIEPNGKPGETNGLQQRLERLLQTLLNLRIPVRLLAPGSLPRFEMKAQRWTRVVE
jgi:phenylacetate-CoA ligase